MGCCIDRAAIAYTVISAISDDDTVHAQMAIGLLDETFAPLPRRRGALRLAHTLSYQTC